MNNLHSFLKEKLKEKNMRIETLVERTNMSRSSIYRIMKGYQTPSEELLVKIVDILRLNSLEEQKLRYYSSLRNSNSEMLSARDEILNLLYLPSATTDCEELEFVYYEREKYMRTYRQILEMTADAAAAPGFSCRFRILNCCSENILLPLIETISALNSEPERYTLEHLITFSANDHKENMVTLKNAAPLLGLDNYRVLYSEGTDASHRGGILSDLLIINYQYQDQNGQPNEKHLYLSFLQGALSACYAAADPYLIEFFERNYRALYQEYKLAFNNEKKFEFIEEFFRDAESNYDMYLFKPNFSWNRIPFHLYQRLEARVAPEVVGQFLSAFLESSVSTATVADQLTAVFTYIKARIDASFTRRQIDICTRSGLESFAATGMFSDHLEGFPPFDKEEIRQVFAYIKERDADPNDKYNLYILKNEHYSNDQIMVCCYKDRGLLLEYRNSDYSNHLPYCIVEHEGLTRSFADFAENYVPNMLAMNQKEAGEFIDGLMERYC